MNGVARIDLDYPDDAFTYSLEMTVRGTDVNAAYHLANDRLIAMLSEARFRYWIDAGMVDPQTSKGSLIVTDLVTVYKAEARPWDCLRFYMGFADRNRYGGDVVFRVTRPADSALIAVAKSGFVCFDYTAGRVTPIGDDVVAALLAPGSRFAV